MINLAPPSNEARSDSLTTNKILQPPSWRPQKGTTCGDTWTAWVRRNFTRKHKAASLNAMFSEKQFFFFFFFQGLHSSISADVNRKLATRLISKNTSFWRGRWSPELGNQFTKIPVWPAFHSSYLGDPFHFPEVVTRQNMGRWDLLGGGLQR